jgi:hypothetical protein
MAFSLTDLLGTLSINTGTGAYPFDLGVESWVELYFDTAPGAEPNLLSVMDLFRISATNNALSFSPRSVRDRDFSWSECEPDWGSLYRLEVRGVMTNRPAMGVVTVEIGAGLTDTLGNRNDRAFRLLLLK